MPAKSSFSPETMDRIGIIASTACFVHCLIIPVLISLSAVFAHALPSEESTHRILAMVVTIVGAIALVNGFRRHGRSSALGMMTCGLMLIFAAAFFGDRLPSHGYEVAITLAGSCCMITAHRLNHTFCRRCNKCT